ncbi:nucleoside recognition domain protein [Denitrovibrio acetiphilus DSM 12809]|uniref:Nucleoside recognition domain protein n=1 Tax=Denitrovibrio acetiphilus (strain DSM 12809 / NBRC 114555 / N2460) TaxID=522772 RepID=D4H2Z6_DENA2|nr:nucleoside recognition domain-containing protein [Denitrovibrio acetiphilus]ADD69019.1 nucleoside recognition domain protein [Denitrovibrio acetiphilus DSM 12809]
MIKSIIAVVKETVDICVPLFRILVPMIVVIKILQETGLVSLLGKILTPLMFITGLPGEMGLAWASALATNMYGGVIIFATLVKDVDMTVAQTTVFASMILMAHAFPVELQISKQAGTRFRAMFLFRFGSALIFGALLNVFYKSFNLLQQPVSTFYSPAQRENTLLSWAYGEIVNLGYIALIIFTLVVLMKIFKKIGLIKFINMLCRPLLKLMGIGEQAAYVTVVGFTLGLTYGSGLIIKEAKSGSMSHKDIFFSLGFMGICHSMVEDTILMLAIGADFFGIFVLRTVFSVLFVAVLVRLSAGIPEKFFYRWLFMNK